MSLIGVTPGFYFMHIRTGGESQNAYSVPSLTFTRIRLGTSRHKNAVALPPYRLDRLTIN